MFFALAEFSFFFTMTKTNTKHNPKPQPSTPNPTPTPTPTPTRILYTLAVATSPYLHSDAGVVSKWLGSQPHHRNVNRKRFAPFQINLTLRFA